GQGLDQMGMGMAQGGDGNAAAEIQIFAPVGGDEIGAFAPLERHIGPSVSRQNSWNHESLSGKWVKRESTTTAFSVVARTLRGAFSRVLPASPSPTPWRETQSMGIVRVTVNREA